MQKTEATEDLLCECCRRSEFDEGNSSSTADGEEGFCVNPVALELLGTWAAFEAEREPKFPQQQGACERENLNNNGDVKKRAITAGVSPKQ